MGKGTDFGIFIFCTSLNEGGGEWANGREGDSPEENVRRGEWATILYFPDFLRVLPAIKHRCNSDKVILLPIYYLVVAFNKVPEIFRIFAQKFFFWAS